MTTRAWSVGGALVGVGLLVGASGAGCATRALGISADGGTNGGVEEPYAGEVQIATSWVEALFTPAQIPEPEGDCVTTDGACTISDCTLPAGYAAANFGVGAGTLSLNGSQSSSTLTLSYDAATRVYDQSLSAPLAPPGGQVEVSASGAKVDGFDASILMPADVTVTAPLATGAQATYTFATDSDFDVTWTGGGTGSLVDVAIFPASSSATHYQAIGCQFDAMSGSATIPASVLAHFSDYAGGRFQVASVATVGVSDDNATVNLQTIGAETSGPISAP